MNTTTTTAKKLSPADEARLKELEKKHGVKTLQQALVCMSNAQKMVGATVEVTSRGSSTKPQFVNTHTDWCRHVGLLKKKGCQ